MGYLNDWLAGERAAEEARAAFPDCDMTEDCPASDHLAGCGSYPPRRELRARLRAKAEREATDVADAPDSATDDAIGAL